MILAIAYMARLLDVSAMVFLIALPLLPLRNVYASKSALIDKPANTALTQNGTARLSCSNTDYYSVLAWYHTPGAGGANVRHRVYNGARLADRYLRTGRVSVDESLHGHSDLVIRDVQVEDGGLYTCEVNNVDDTASAYLIILESDTNCWSSQIDKSGPDSQLQLSCSVAHSGHWAPVLRWTTPEGTPIPSVVNTSITTGTTATIYVATSSVLIPTGENSTSYVCAAEFEESARPTGGLPALAGNVPKYNSTCLVKVQLSSYESHECSYINVHSKASGVFVERLVTQPSSAKFLLIAPVVVFLVLLAFSLLIGGCRRSRQIAASDRATYETLSTSTTPPASPDPSLIYAELQFPLNGDSPNNHPLTRQSNTDYTLYSEIVFLTVNNTHDV